MVLLEAAADCFYVAIIIRYLFTSGRNRFIFGHFRIWRSCSSGLGFVDFLKLAYAKNRAAVIDEGTP